MLRTIAGATCCLVLLVAGEAAQAQVGRPPMQYRRPVTSPYLDLVNPARSFEFEYFRRLRPEVDLRQGERDLVRAVEDLNRRITPPPVVPTERIRSIGTTGHPTQFRSLSTYFRPPVGVGASNIGSR
jgi:hypothetical protein